MLPNVAIVILNWNKKDDLLKLLSLVKKINYENYAIILVDNASTDGSVLAATKSYPEITVIQNDQNVGGSAGFNTGLRYVCENNMHKYVWLLDNDVLIESDTLLHLVKAMENDSNIGLAGSRIVDKNDKNSTVELGAFLRKDRIGVTPNCGNSPNCDAESIVDVDYVAVCSALVRVNALGLVGFMDERFFVFWDDIDWGVIFNSAGFRVVAVYQSVAYHDAFVEKSRGDYTDFYYGVRNSLLVYSKNFGFLERSYIFLKSISILCMLMMYYFISGQSHKGSLIFRAFLDFCFDRWGRCGVSIKTGPHASRFASENGEIKRILILSGPKEEIYYLKKWCEDSFNQAELILLVREDRVTTYQKEFSCMIVVDPQRVYSIGYWFFFFFKLLFANFDLFIRPYSTDFPFLSYAAKQSCFLQDGTVWKDKQSRRHFYSLPLSFFAGLLVASVVTPFVSVKSVKYSKSKRKRIKKF